MLSLTSTTTATFVALTWRIFIATTTRTFFQPDEFFQSLEVAHHAVFGYGHLTWEWIASPPIRSVFFPAVYMPVYAFLKTAGLENTHAIIVAPKMLQGVIAAITDISTRELARQLLGERYANAAFLLSMTSFFNMLSLGRTLSNSVETSLTVAALRFWPWHPPASKSKRQISTALALAAVSCMVRPTSAILWAFLILERLWRFRVSNNHVLFKQLLVISISVALLSSVFLLGIDSWYFQTWTITPLNFVITNLSSVSSFYGRSPWHYYLTQGIPLVLNVSIPLFCRGVWTTLKTGSTPLRTIIYLILWTLSIYSLLGHKEWRFIHPLLPLMHVVSAKALVDSTHGSTKSRKAGAGSKKENKQPLGIHLLPLLGVLPGFYVMYFHGRAQVSVISYLRSVDQSDLRSVGFLMPCHSTPWQSHLHRPHLRSEGQLWALGCEPPLGQTNSSNYRDQNDIFYSSPMKYLNSNFPNAVDPSFPPSPFPATKPGSPPPSGDKWDHRWPSHLIFFGALLEEENEGRQIGDHLRGLGYTEEWVGRNGFEEDWRRRGDILVWRWRSVT